MSGPSRGPPMPSFGSTPGGVSILITSAPKSANCRTQVGPARTRERSSTRKRASAADAEILGMGLFYRPSMEAPPMFRYLAFLLLSCSCHAALADSPERPVRMVVPQAAGSATDNFARLLAPELGKKLGQPIVVDNRPGGALTIGIDAVAKAAPDGYTIGLGPVGALAITRHMVAKLPYDIERDLQPVALVQSTYMMLAVSPKLPIHSVPELIAYAKKNPGKLSNASSSNGSPGHVSGELFKYMTGTEILHVPYKGGAAAIGDLMSGNVDLMFESSNSMAAHVKAGRVRGLALTGAKRSKAFPDLPTVGETVAGYEVNAWSGI